MNEALAVWERILGALVFTCLAVIPAFVYIALVQFVPSHLAFSEKQKNPGWIKRHIKSTYLCCRRWWRGIKEAEDTSDETAPTGGEMDDTFIPGQGAPESGITNPYNQIIPVDMSFHNVVYSVPLSGKSHGSKDEPHRKTILKGISGHMYPGTLTAIIGPSGCGKTTLLDILAGRKSDGSLSGTIICNDQILERKSFNRISAYVMQDDCLFPYLTVRQMLMYTAEFRINSLSGTQKQERVERVMQDLNLLAVADRKIGEEAKGGLSRGQKRRITVAMELITFPSVLFLDEPTSGLDSTSSLKLMKTLKDLARRGNRTVICTIHQPRTDIFQIFDNIVLMIAGGIAYTGSRHGILDYFKDIGHPLPENTNPADFIIDLTQDQASDHPDKLPQTHLMAANHSTSISLNPSVEGLGSFVRERHFMQSENSLHEAAVSQSTLIEFHPSLKKLTLSRDHLLLSYASSNLKTSNEEELDKILRSVEAKHQAESEEHINTRTPERYSVSVWSQTVTLIRRAHTNHFSNPGYYANWLIGICSFLFYGLIYLGLRLSSNMDRSGLAYLESQRAFIFQILSAIIFYQLETMTNMNLEKRLSAREFSSGTYSRSAYHISWIFRIAYNALTHGLVFPPFVYFMSGLEINFVKYLVFVMVFMWMDMIGSSLSLLLVSTISSLESCTSAFSAATSFLGSTSGFFLRPKLIPVWFIWAYYGGFYKYGLDALYINEYSGLVDSKGESVLTSLFDVDPNLSMWENVLILPLYPITFEFLAWLLGNGGSKGIATFASWIHVKFSLLSHKLFGSR